MRGRTSLGIALICVTVAAACTPKVVELPTVTTPRFPDFIKPTVPDASAQSEAARYLDRAWQFLQAGDVRSADREAALALKSAPDFYPAETASGYIALARKDEKEAVTRFNRALSHRDEYASAWAGKAMALAEDERDAEAIAAYSRAIDLDPTLAPLERRVEVLRLRVVQREIATARQAAKAGKADDAIRAYHAAINSSPDSAFLYRELAAIERSAGQVEPALQHYRKATELDPADAASFADLADLLVEHNELDAALKAYGDALAIAPDASIEARRNAARDRAEMARLPAEFRAIESAVRITRADLAALIGVRVPVLLQGSPRELDVVTDIRGHWAESWIQSVLRAGIMDSFANHTFQPREIVRRVDFAEAVTRLLARVAELNPAAARAWENARGRFPDLAAAHVAYPAASTATAAGVMQPAADGSFQPSREVTGAEALQSLDRLRALLGSRVTATTQR